MRECLDASVIVKWFKKDEPHRKEAEILFQRIKDFEAEFIVSEWVLLEVTRGLVKAGVKKNEVIETNRILNDLLAVGAIKTIPVTQVLDLATDIEIELDLYAADAVHLATAITTNSKILWSEDEHLHKNKVKDYAKKLEIRTLDKQ